MPAHCPQLHLQSAAAKALARRLLASLLPPAPLLPSSQQRLGCRRPFLRLRPPLLQLLPLSSRRRRAAAAAAFHQSKAACQSCSDWVNHRARQAAGNPLLCDPLGVCRVLRRVQCPAASGRGGPAEEGRGGAAACLPPLGQQALPEVADLQLGWQEASRQRQRQRSDMPGV